MPQNEPEATKVLRIIEILYLLTLAFSFYLLVLSRTGEAHTIWEVLHPAFIPTLFVATFLLLTILLRSEKAEYTLLLVIAHSILIHSLFSIVFPTGDLSGQQMVLGRSRLVFDNSVFHGWTPWAPATLQSQVYEWFRGITFQAALSVVFARMLSMDLLWVHLFLVPALWGIFTPFAAFLIMKTLNASDKVAVLSSLVISAFPYATYFGAISVPNSLGYLFLFYSLYFTLRNFDSRDSQINILAFVLGFFSFLSHFLTGIISFSLIFLAIAFKSFKDEKTPTAKISLALSFLFCTSLLPLALIYLRFFQPSYRTVFTLGKLFELPINEVAGLFFFGELIYGFGVKTILLTIAGPAIAFFFMLYLLFSLKRKGKVHSQTHVAFLFSAFLLASLDYIILKLFMDGLPFNEERLWVLREFIAAPFVALAIHEVFSQLKSLLRIRDSAVASFLNIRSLLKRNSLHILGVLFALNVLVPTFVAGWITLSLHVAYPRIAPLQTTWYELEAVRYIEENTIGKYVVVGDQWTIFAGEAIVGVNNPRAYYFLEFNRTGYDLFNKMRVDPSPEVLIEAMSVNNATVAYFIITQPRLGNQEFNTVLSKALQNGLQTYGQSTGFGNGRLYVFQYEKK